MRNRRKRLPTDITDETLVYLDPPASDVPPTCKPRYWRELPLHEQADAIASAAAFLERHPTVRELDLKLSRKRRASYGRIAADRFKHLFDLPPTFSRRAIMGLKAAILLAVIDEAEDDDVCSDPEFSSILHLLAVEK